jgi:hypothetical protein
LGQRESWGEQFDEKDAFEKEHDKKHRPYVHYIEAEPISTEDAELQICCAGISNARDILYKCARQGGLISRDVKKLVASLIGCGHGDILEPLPEPFQPQYRGGQVASDELETQYTRPNLAKIFKQLGITSALCNDVRSKFDA